MLQLLDADSSAIYNVLRRFNDNTPVFLEIQNGIFKLFAADTKKAVSFELTAPAYVPDCFYTVKAGSLKGLFYLLGNKFLDLESAGENIPVYFKRENNRSGYLQLLPPASCSPENLDFPSNSLEVNARELLTGLKKVRKNNPKLKGFNLTVEGKHLLLNGAPVSGILKNNGLESISAPDLKEFIFYLTDILRDNNRDMPGIKFFPLSIAATKDAVYLESKYSSNKARFKIKV